MLSEGRSLLQSAPLLRNNPPDCFAIHTPQSALRVKISLIAMSDRGLCPLDTHKPFFEGLDPKIYRPTQEKFLKNRFVFSLQNLPEPVYRSFGAPFTGFALRSPVHGDFDLPVGATAIFSPLRAA